MTKKHDCPSCDEDFDTEHGMKTHHSQTHGESIARVERECENCGEGFEVYKSKNLITLCRDCHFRWEGVPVFPVTGGEADA